MNKNAFKIAALFMSMLAMLTFSSCSSDDDEDEVIPGGSQLEVKSVVLPNPGYGTDNWIYFSLSEGKIVEGINESNRHDNTKWDLAFYRYNVRTNSGLSGIGQGGALDTKATELSAVASVPSGDFTTDVMGEVTSSMSSFPPPTIETPLNEMLSSSIKFQGPPPTYTPNNHVYIVRTADGKYAKIQIRGFYNDEGKSGFINFSYVYQPDGSKKF